jgi:hypothetical protein
MGRDLGGRPAARVTAPRVSVVMPVRNGAAYLEEAVGSVLSQTLEDLELIVVDDGSTDATPAILERVARSDDRVRVLRIPPSGLTPALNRGWREARADYVARLDADDVALPTRLANQAAFLDDHPEVGVVGSAYVPLSHTGERLGIVRYAVDDATLRADLLRYNCLPHPTVMVRRAALEEADGYRLDQAEDYDLWLRIAERWDLANLAEPLILYRHHAGQFSVGKLERQTLGAVAVRAAAAARAQGRPDPLEGVETLDEAILPRLGVRPDDFARAVSADRATWAGVLAGVGDEASALALLSGAEGKQAGRRAFVASARLYRGRTLYRSGDRRRGWALILSALVTHPIVVGREAVRRARSR